MPEPWKISPRWIALIAVTAVVLYLCWLIMRPLIDVLLWAGVLAIAAQPLNAALRARGRGPGVSAMFSTLLVMLTVVLPLTFVVTTLVGEVTSAVDDLVDGMRRVLDPKQPVLRGIDRVFDIDPYLKPEFLSERLRAVSGSIAGKTVSIVGSLLDMFAKSLMIVFTLFYLLRDHDKVAKGLRDFLPLNVNDSNDVLARCHQVISASMYGVLLIAIGQGVLGGIGFWFCGLSRPLVWGAVMVLFAMIPLAGAAIIWLPAAIYLFAGGHWIKGLVLVLWGVFAVGMLDNLLRPILVGGRTRMHELVVFFSVLGGLQVFGVLGLVVGPVLVALAVTLIDVFRRAGGARPMPVGAAD